MLQTLKTTSALEAVKADTFDYNPIAERFCLVNVRIKRWTASKLDRKATGTVRKTYGNKEGSARVHKTLVAKTHFDEISNICTEAREYHTELTQPWLTDGQRILILTKYSEYEAKMRGFKERFKAAVTKFLDSYAQFREEAQADLSGLFSETDYPTARALEAKFSFDFSVQKFPTNNDDIRLQFGAHQTEQVRAKLEAHVRADVERSVREAVENALADTRERITKVVGHMATKLREYKPAEKKRVRDRKTGKMVLKTVEEADGIFRDSLVDNVAELAKLLPLFNLTNDPKFDRIAKRIKNELVSETAEDLREDEDLRDTVATSAESILEEVNAFMA